MVMVWEPGARSAGGVQRIGSRRPENKEINFAPKSETEISAAGMGAAGEAGLFEESEIGQEGGDQHQAVNDSRFNIDIFEIDPLGLNTHFNLSRNKTANNNDIIAKPRLIVNSRSLRILDPFSELGTITRTPNQPADKTVLQLRRGWNGVGLAAEKATTAVQILDEIQPLGEVSQTSQCEVCETADQVARWEFGMWDAVVKRRYSPEHNEIYGRDFPIKETEGYFVHANEDVRLQ